MDGYPQGPLRRPSYLPHPQISWKHLAVLWIFETNIQCRNFSSFSIDEYFLVKRLKDISRSVDTHVMDQRQNPHLVKGTQDWEFFWLRFLNLRYFFVSYVKILRFYKKKFLLGPLLREVQFFRVVLGLRGINKNFEVGQNFFFIFFNYGP
jgi:hypothetical protein